MNLEKENLRKIRGLILFTIIVLITLWQYNAVLQLAVMCMNILFPFIVGGAIAFILNVPMNFIEKKIFKNKEKTEGTYARGISLLLTIVFVCSIIAIVIFVVVPKLGTTLISLGKNIQVFVLDVQRWLESLFNDNPDIIRMIKDVEINWDKLLNSMITFFKSGAGSVLGSTVTVAKSIVSGVTTFVISFVFSCYILLQKERLSIQIKKILYAYLKESRVEKVLSICKLTYRTFSNFLTGQCVEAVILGTMFVVAMSILRMPYALLVGVLIAFTALIPIFGAFIGCVIGTFLILVESPIKALIFLILFFVLQQVEGNFIYPKVVGNSVGLPSIWVLAAVSIGGSLMGIVGMLIFIPMISVLYTLLRGHVYQRLEQKGVYVDDSSGKLLPISKSEEKALEK